MATPDLPAPHAMPAAEVVAALGGDARSGLSAEEAAARLAAHGPNELPHAPPTPAWRKFLAQFQNPLTVLLLVATLISAAAWLIERDTPLPYETITILAIVILNGVLGYVQENRAEQAVAALRAMASPTTRVLRAGQPQVIPTAAVVPGDLLLIEEGDTIAADARVLESVSLRVAEAALTGESAPVSKHVAPVPADAGPADRRSMVFSGTAAAAGRGRAIVTATGAATQIGAIAGSLQQAEDEQTPLQRELDRVGKLLGAAVIGIAVVISGTILLVGQARALSHLVDVLLLAVSLAVAAVPEGLTAITTIVLSLGMQRMAGRNVIVRRLAAVETLGSTTVICTDKTGTLTRNEMTVRTVVTAGGRVDLSGVGYDPHGEALHGGRPLELGALRTEVRRTVRAANMANNAALVEQGGRWAVQGDPTEGALLVAARKLGYRQDELEARFPRVAEAPFSSERKLMSTAHEDAQQGERAMLFAKGAPDVLLARCSHERVGDDAVPLSDERRAAILAAVERLAAEALRTLGVAYRTMPIADVASADGHAPAAGPDDADQHPEDAEHDLVFLGVVGMIDPPRAEAQAAVGQARAAGIRPIMITGDHPATAAAIAAELGIAAPGEPAVTGAELQRTTDEELAAIVQRAAVFARVAPEHKLRIVRALRSSGAITAMTGDGVNDAPALKAADIGVAMGVTGTDVAKGAADMVLTDDNFASIVAAVEEGRSIFANIQKFLRYLLSSNIGEVLTMFFGVLLGGWLGLGAEGAAGLAAPLLATQILWINLLTDSAPALALGLEPADTAVMRRPPRDPRSRVITRRMWLDIVFVGAIMAVGTLGVMDWSLAGGLLSRPGAAADLDYARTLAFTTLVFFQLFNVFNARSDDTTALRGLGTNPWLWLAVALSAGLQAAVVYLPPLQEAFSTVPLSLADWLTCAAVASSVLVLYELLKLLRR